MNFKQPLQARWWRVEYKIWHKLTGEAWDEQGKIKQDKTDETGNEQWKPTEHKRRGAAKSDTETKWKGDQGKGEQLRKSTWARTLMMIIRKQTQANTKIQQKPPMGYMLTLENTRTVNRYGKVSSKSVEVLKTISQGLNISLTTVECIVEKWNGYVTKKMLSKHKLPLKLKGCNRRTIIRELAWLTKYVVRKKHTKKQMLHIILNTLSTWWNMVMARTTCDGALAEGVRLVSANTKMDLSTGQAKQLSQSKSECIWEYKEQGT